MSDSLIPDIVQGPGKGTTINLTGDEIARALWEWLEFRHGIMVSGPRTVTVDGELLRDREGRVYVDPSGKIGRVPRCNLPSDNLDCDCQCCESVGCVCGDDPCPCDKTVYAVVALTASGPSVIPTTVNLVKGKAAAQKEIRRMIGVVTQAWKSFKVDRGPSNLWARVQIEDCGVGYAFHAEKASWVETAT